MQQCDGSVAVYDMPSSPMLLLSVSKYTLQDCLIDKHMGRQAREIVQVSSESPQQQSIRDMHWAWSLVIAHVNSSNGIAKYKDSHQASPESGFDVYTRSQILPSSQECREPME